jgi:hypothetical protein
MRVIRRRSTSAVRQDDLRPMAWFSAQDYPVMRDVIFRPEMMPACYEDWQKTFEARFSKAKSEGKYPIKVDVEPNDYLSWCHNNDFKVNRTSLASFCHRRMNARLETPNPQVDEGDLEVDTRSSR